MPKIQRGEIWLVDFNPTSGREQQGQRPAVVLSSNLMNMDLIELAYVAPGTTRDRKVPNHVRVEPSKQNGLREATFFMGEQVRSLSTRRFLNRIGIIADSQLIELGQILIMLMELGSD